MHGAMVAQRCPLGRYPLRADAPHQSLLAVSPHPARRFTTVLIIPGYGRSGVSRRRWARAYAAGWSLSPSLSPSTATRPITSAERSGTGIQVIPPGTSPVQQGPVSPGTPTWHR
jgi:hypothetical protein